jgi:hypothetical protein
LGPDADIQLKRWPLVEAVDRNAGSAQSAVMRFVFAVGLLTLLAGCSGDPRSFGITGPGTQPEPAAPAGPTPDTTTAPGMSTTGPMYGPSIGPSNGNSGFWGYN